MKQPRKTSKGFTILELMITVMIAGIMTAFALPNYTRSLDLAVEKDIVAQLNVIHAAQNSYFSRNRVFMATTASLAIINNNLGTNIIANGNRYSMVQGAGGRSYTLTVLRTGGATPMTVSMTDGAWDPRLTTGTPGNPRCVAASCPSLR